MSRHGAPARPWYDLVIETIALKGWTKAQLADRSGVSRPTVDNWRTNPKPPQARSVNAVADALGIPREHALRLAGVIAGPSEAERSPPPALSEATKAMMREELGDELAARLIAHYEHLVSGRTPPAAEDDPARGSAGKGRRSAG